MACVAFVWVVHIAVRHSSCLQGRTIVRNNRLPPPKLLPTLFLNKAVPKGEGRRGPVGMGESGRAGDPVRPSAPPPAVPGVCCML